jgi:hypothetical protein
LGQADEQARIIHDCVQEKEQALIAISENAQRHIERSRADRARTYDTLLKQYA